MTCLRAQSLITSFINDELNIKELEEFLEHVHSCGECMEELEVYYTSLTAMKQLDEDRNLSDDYRMELDRKLARSQEKIVRLKYVHYRKKGMLMLIILLLATYLSLMVNLTAEEGNRVTKSNFRMRVSFDAGRYKELDAELTRYLEETGSR